MFLYPHPRTKAILLHSPGTSLSSIYITPSGLHLFSTRTRPKTSHRLRCVRRLLHARYRASGSKGPRACESGQELGGDGLGGQWGPPQREGAGDGRRRAVRGDGAGRRLQHRQVAPVRPALARRLSLRRLVQLRIQPGDLAIIPFVYIWSAAVWFVLAARAAAVRLVDTR